MAQTALQYIRALAEETTEFGEGTTTLAGSATSFVDAKYLNSNLAPTEFSRMSVLIEAGACAGQVGSLTTLTRSSGAVSTATTFTTTIAAGVAYSLYNLLPPLRTGVLPSFLQVANQSLRRLWVPDSISISGVTSQIHYTVDTDTYPWWTDPARIIAIEYPVTASDDVPQVLDRGAWDWVSDGETRKLRFSDAPFATGQTFVVRLYRPANSRLKLNATAYGVLTASALSSAVLLTGGYYTSAPAITVSGGGGTGATATAVLAVTPGPVTSITITAGGTGYTSAPTISIASGAWADQTSQTAGLAALTDQALADVADVLTMGKAVMYELLSQMRAPAADVTEWLSKARPRIAAARALQAAGLPQERSTGVANLRSTSVATDAYRQRS